MASTDNLLKHFTFYWNVFFFLDGLAVGLKSFNNVLHVKKVLHNKAIADSTILLRTEKGFSEKEIIEFNEIDGKEISIFFKS